MNSAPQDKHLKAFTTLLANEQIDPDLEEIALVLCQVLDIECQESLFREELDLLANTVVDRTPEGLIAVLFRSGLLAGDRVQYDHPHNSLPHKALSSGRGLPITLCILALLVSRRCNIELWGVGLPGHFVVGAKTENGTEFFDPFNGGIRLSRDQCIAIASITGVLTDSEGLFRPISTRSIVIRILNNLTQSYRRRSDWVGLRAVVSLRLAVPELRKTDLNATLALVRELN